MSQPTLSIVIPVRNEAAYIERCLDSIYAQDFAGHDYEVIAVDGLSTDGTLKKIQNLKSKYPNLKDFENHQKTVSTGVNLGIRASQGEIIVRMDAHARYEPDYIRNCLQALKRTGAGNVGGPQNPLPGSDTLLSWSIWMAHLSPFGLGAGFHRNPYFEGYVETVWPGCFLRKALKDSGLIDERLTRSEDIELNNRLRKCGYKIFQTPAIRAYYYCRRSWGSLWRQRWLDGIGAVQTLAVNPRAPRLRHFVPLAFVASLIVLSLFSWFALLFRMLLLAELGLYILAMIFYTARAAYDVKKYSAYNLITKTDSGPKAAKALALLPVVFIVLHLSYGLGSLWALLTLPVWWARFHKPLRFDLQEKIA